ncbi:hypothetical protein GQX73_g1384 [Xylaria multiplex]|uniref:Uncharacterized protein n=1 Tax=Xylaria multiplex TaxID=323545 RepID=A0A7C8IVV7_9PEZI|nr:hypothetical protein GQX73_g1384 [Xylaria multiplex]
MSIAGFSPESASSASINLESKIRSTQNELQKLFLQTNYRELRPRNRGESRQRVEALRRIRHGRINKGKAPRVLGITQASKRSTSYHMNLSTSRATDFTPDIDGTYPEAIIPNYVAEFPNNASVVELPDNSIVAESLDNASIIEFPDNSIITELPDDSSTSGLLGSSIDNMSIMFPFDFGDTDADHASMVPSGLIDSKKQPKTLYSTSRRRVRLSWVREIFRSACSSSACSDIRSLLSSLSSRTSWNEPATPVQDPLLLALEGIPTIGDNTNLIRMCCRPSRLRGGYCVHRKFIAAIMGPTSRLDLEFEDEKDIWNQTPLHLAAKWAPGEVALPILWMLLDNYENDPRRLNTKSIDGKTFMHIITQRWYHLPSHPGLTLALFCSKAKENGYAFDLPDDNGRTFFDCFLDELHMIPALCLRLIEDIDSLLELSSDLDFYQITIMLKPSPIKPFEWFYSDLAKIFSRRVAARGIYGTEQTPLRYGENNFNLLLQSRHAVEAVRAMTVPQALQVNDLDGYNTEGKTCIMVLIETAQTFKSIEHVDTLLDALLSHDPDLRLVDREGNTALHYAVQAQLPNTAHRLISAGIDVSIRNLRGESATQLAALHYRSVSRLPESDRTGSRYAGAQSTLVRLFDSRFRKDRRRKDREASQMQEELEEVIKDLDFPQFWNNPVAELDSSQIFGPSAQIPANRNEY